MKKMAIPREVVCAERRIRAIQCIAGETFDSFALFRPCPPEKLPIMRKMERDSMSTCKAGQSLLQVAEGADDADLKDKLRDIAATRSPVVSNGRFFFQTELNALTFWYEDQTHSTRMIYVKAAE